MYTQASLNSLVALADRASMTEDITEATALLMTA